MSILSSHDQHSKYYFVVYTIEMHTFLTLSDVLYVFLFKVYFLRELRLDSPRVTVISSNHFFIENIFSSKQNFFMNDYGIAENRTHLSIKQNFYQKQ